MKTMKKRFTVVLLLYAISAVTPVLIPFSMNSKGSLNPVGYLAGAMFWIGLAGGSIGYYLIIRKAKSEILNNISKRSRPSALYFFSNRPAMATDIVLIISVIGTIYCAVNVTVNQIVAAIFLLLMLTGIYAHFLLNGNVYQYIWSTKDEKSQNEQQEQLKSGRNEKNE